MKRAVEKYIAKYLLLVLFIGCTSSNKKVEDIKSNVNTTSFPPGTTQICATVLKKLDTIPNTALILSVDTVFAYGHATPILAVGTKIEADIPQNTLLDLGGTTGLDEIIKSDKKLYVELLSRRNSSFDAKNSNKWSITKLSANKIFD